MHRGSHSLTPFAPQIPKLLSCQEPESTRAGKPVHDELLFITVHQGAQRAPR